MNTVIINIKTTQFDIMTKQIETIELITQGKFYKRLNSYFLVYEETEISGMKGTLTTLKFLDNELYLRRRGTTSSLMEFGKGKRYRTNYKTPYGDMIMELLTTNVSVFVEQDPINIDIKIEYDIVIKGMFEGKNSMHITVK